MVRPRATSLLLLGALGLVAIASACSTTAASAPAASDPDAATQPDAGASADAADAPLDPRFFDPDLAPDDVFTRHNPDPARVDVAALEAILTEAAAQESDGVLVADGDTIVAEKYFGHTPGLATIQSITKSVASLAIGALVESGKIPSLEVPVSTYYPEWSSGDKALVTLRHVLEHTSGLRDGATGLFDQPDTLAYARARGLSAKPGTVFAYANVGSMLLAGIIEQAAGIGADAYVRDRFFTPMGIVKWTWSKDAAGNVATPGGLFLAPRDLLRLGRLVRERGAWSGASLVSPAWIAESTATESRKYECYALHWWLLRDGCDADTGLSGTPGPIQGVLADGWGGNYVAVVPASQIVAVRTKAPLPNGTFAEVHKTAYPTFPHEVAALGK